MNDLRVKLSLDAGESTEAFKEVVAELEKIVALVPPEKQPDASRAASTIAATLISCVRIT